MQQTASPESTEPSHQPCFPFARESSPTDSPEAQLRWVTVNAFAVGVENCLQFGGPWLALELAKKIGLDAFLQQHLPGGRADVRWSSMAWVLVICRLCSPSSERHIAEHFYR